MKYRVEGGNLPVLLVSLEAGEEKQICLTIDPQAFTIVDDAGKRYVDSRRFRLYVGTSQPDARSCALTGVQPAVTEVEF